MNEEILDTIRERGLLLERDVFELLNNFNNVSFAKDLLIGLEQSSGQKMINRSILSKHFEIVKNITSKLEGDDRERVDNVLLNLD